MKIKKTLLCVFFFTFTISFIQCNIDLNVENHNAPDRDSVLSDPDDVETYLGSAFRDFWDSQTSYYGIVYSTSCLADEFTCSWGIVYDISSEPRTAWDNSPSYGYQYVTESAWKDAYSAVSIANDVMHKIAGGMTFVDSDGNDNAQRNTAFAKFIQGISLGFLGLVFDQAVFIDESVDLETHPKPMPYDQIIEKSIGKLNDCISICQTHEFVIPEAWWPGNDYDQDDLERLAHSYAARILAGEARCPDERFEADWNTIKNHAQQGITEDFGTYNDGIEWWSYLHGLGSNSNWFRADYKLIGPADTSGHYADWLTTPVQERTEFLIHTEDLRVTGNSPESDGTYFGYYGPSPFRENRGTYHFSMYHCNRFFDYYNAGYVGWVPILTVAEINLLLAEAEIRLGNAQAAADLINLTRVPNGGLPPASPGNIGHPSDPRSSRGSLWAMLKYEKGLETCQANTCVAWCDRRGWGTLVPGSLIHFPIPGAQLELMGLEIYTFGGWSGPGSAR